MNAKILKMKKIIKNKKANEKSINTLVTIIVAVALIIIIIFIVKDKLIKGSDNYDNFFKCENNIMYAGGEIETACMFADDCTGKWFPYIDNVEEAEKAGCQGKRICCMNLP